MARRIVTTTEIARIKGVSQPAVAKWLKRRGRPARCGNRVDLDHRATIDYLGQHYPGRPTSADPGEVASAAAVPAAGPLPDPAPRVAGKPGRPPRLHPPDLPPAPAGVLRMPTDINEDPAVFAEMTLDRVAREYASMEAFSKVVTAVKCNEQTVWQRIKNRELEGRVISRELVEASIMGALEREHRQLLGNAAKTIARRLYPAARSGVPLEEAEQITAKIIESELRPIRDAIAKSLRTASAPVAAGDGDAEAIEPE